MSDEEPSFAARLSAIMPKYKRYNIDLSSSYDEYDALPTHLKLMPLPEFLDYVKPGEVLAADADVLFEVEGYAAAELFLSIFVRTARDFANYFPIIKFGLEGSVIDAFIENDPHWFKAAINSQPRGLMYGKGAFRSLISYLERELPPRGFKGIYLEQVHNEILQSVALRYGFERLSEPSPKCFIKRLPSAPSL